MHEIYQYSSYKIFIKEYCELKDLTFASVADAARMHRQYLTQVLRHKAHLNDEQTFYVGRFLGLRDEELDYFLLLVQEEKMGHGIARNHFAAKRAAIQEEKKRAGVDLNQSTVRMSPSSEHAFADYYLDLSLQLCHAHLFIPAFQKNPEALAEKLQVSSAVLAKHLEKLQDLGLVERIGREWRSLAAFLHLEKGSTLSWQNHRNWRLYAANLPLPSLDQDKNLFFSSTIVSEPQVQQHFVTQLRKLIAQLHKSLPSTKDEKIFQVNMDVFGIGS